MRDVIARVEAYEPHIHATYLFAPERALAEAEAATARWAQGRAQGPLDGVPVTVKDNIATKGEPKPVGTAATDLTPQPQDAPPAARLREAGAIIFAKTDHAGLRHAVVGAVELSSAGAQSVGSVERAGRLVGGRGGGRGGGLRAAASGHRHRRLDPPAGGLVRACSGSSRAPAAFRSIRPIIGRVAGPLTRNADDAALMMATL